MQGIVCAKQRIRELPKLRQSALEAPWCFACYTTPPRGSLCLAHPNEQTAGKGMGLKGVDYLGAIVCQYCHDLIDGRTGNLTREESQAMHHDAHRRTLIWWFENGYIKA